MVADLDYLSGGRVDFGVGIGWLKEEFDNLRMDFATRAARTLEYLEVMRALWSPGLATYEGGAYSLAPCHFNPKPVQSPPSAPSSSAARASRRCAGRLPRQRLVRL